MISDAPMKRACQSRACQFNWHGNVLDLLAERAVWDSKRRILLVADLHLGKAEAFQANGIPLPSDGDASTLNVLLDLAAWLQPREVIVLGDLIHGPLGLTPELRDKLRRLPELLECPLRLIGGNHERGSWIADLPQHASLHVGPWWLSHEPQPSRGRLNICGHLHPVALLAGRTDRLRLPCFSYCPHSDRLVLPAFGALTGGMPMPRRERQWLVASGAVLVAPQAKSGDRRY
jgi:uncharacterized protein